MPDLDFSEYQVISPEKATVGKVLSELWDRFGRPTDPFSRGGEKLMEVLISTWQDLFPRDSREWIAMRAEYKENEMDIKDQVRKNTGRSLASYPMYIYQMMKRLFPGFDPGQRDNAIKMVKKYPIFRLANRV